MISITVLFFANLRDVTGERRIILEIPSDITVSNLKEILLKNYPDLDQYMPAVIVSVNHEFAGNDSKIPQNAEVAIFPPVSGG